MMRFPIAAHDNSEDALSWLANNIEVPLLTEIKRALGAYLEETEAKDYGKVIVAETAVVLLVDLTGTQLKYTPFRTGFLADQAWEQQLWSLAAQAVAKMLAD